jgi:hypothetical protein
MPDIAVRLGIHAYMYEIAQEHATNSKALDQKDARMEAKESMISIIFTFTCLEAYINTVGIDNLGEAWDNFKDNPPKSKWIGVSNRLYLIKFGKKRNIFKAGEEPFKSFLRLKTIRDKLTHLKPVFETAIETKYGHSDPILNIVNCGTAEWACKLVPMMVHKIDDLLLRPYPIWIK